MFRIIKQIITDLLDTIKLREMHRQWGKWEKAESEGKRLYVGTHPALWMAQAIYENKTVVRGITPEQQRAHLLLAIVIFQECVGLKDEAYIAALFNSATMEVNK